MPEEPVDTPNAAPDGSQADTANVDADPNAGHPDDFYLDTYRTKEDAAKGLSEAKAFAERMKAERDDALRNGTKTQEELLQKLVELQTASAKPAQTPVDMDKIYEEWENGDAKTQLGLLKQVFVDETASKAEIAELKKALEGFQEQVGSKLSDVDPKYLKYKDKVAELKEQFPTADRAMLVQFAEMVSEKTPPANDPRPELAGGTATPVAATPEPSSGLSAADKALMESVIGPMSEDMLKAASRSR
jgi:hypothetical protein